ncbi:MAG TPA: UDP-3-O-(3-hydroxymyristoyl)glucosamine N-acyltransferase [Ignavibacteriaceae bacterium]|nr:UDP-3-O-(3-hydroxymyristoyl)glucosamine N-acyltransferase [Ignavibacteriaceae bacterium]
MNVTIKEIALLTGALVTGDEGLLIESVSRIENASSGSLTFLYMQKFEKYFASTKATAIFVKKGFDKTRDDITYLEVDDPNKSFFFVVKKFFSPEFKLSGIDKSASVHPGSVLGENCAIGKNVVVSEKCKTGRNVKIFHNTVLMEGVEIGNDVLIFPNVTIRENCKIGDRVIIHSGSVIGSDGFGYTPNEKGEYMKIPQIGNVVIEDDVEIGSNVSIDRAMLGSTVIKKGSKIDNLVQIAHNVVIGENTAISAQSGVSGSTEIGKNVIVAGQVGFADHLVIADRVIVAAKSGISKSLTKPGIYFGSPAKEHREALRLEGHIRNLPDYAAKLKELEKKIEELSK